MNDSQYNDALAALREVEAPSPERAAATRAAILRAMTQSAAPIAAPLVASRRRPIVAALLLAAALGGTAFASNTVARWRTRAEPVPVASSSQHRAPVGHPAARPSPAPGQSAPSVAPPSPVASIAPANSSPAPSHARRTIPVARPVVHRAPAAAPSIAPSSDALYTAAHEAHFSQRDYGSALARWDAYIAAAPQGHFVPEAQFNRIVCLVRLGRREDAVASIRALPLAHYRRVEADRLLERLTATP